MTLDFAERNTLPGGIGVATGQVMTVQGPIPVAEMGVTLMHEHILIDGTKSWACPCHPDLAAIAEQPVSIEIIGELRMNPYINRDNVSLDDSDLALTELKMFQKLGGHTVVDPTNIGIGRDPVKLARISRMSGLKIVMGSGFYLEHTHPDWLKGMDVDDVTEFLVNDVGGGTEKPAVMAGIIGEVGVSKDFTAEERKSLRASKRGRKISPPAFSPPSTNGQRRRKAPSPSLA